MEIRLRPVETKDIDFLLNLRGKTMQIYGAEISEESDSSDMSRVMYSFENIKIINYRQKAVGMIKIFKNESKSSWYIYQFQVDPEFQGLGIGKVVLSELCESAIQNEVSIGLSVFKTNPAISLYKRLGFNQVSSNKHEYEMVFNA